MPEKPLRWGILSAAKICNDFLAAMTTLPAGENLPVAIAARSKKSAQEMADKFNIPTVYEGYEALAEDSNVEIVYVGTLNNFHFEWIKTFLNAGKHVFCEKTLCLNADQTKEVFDLAQSKKLFLAEAMWSRYNPSINKMREIIRSGSLGAVKSVEANLGIDIINVPRIKKKEFGGGALLDLGVYAVMGVLTGFNDEKPSKVSVTGSTDKDSGVDDKVEMQMEFSDGRIGIAKTSALEQYDQICTVTLEQGKIVLPDFWSGYKVEIHRNDKPDDVEKLEFPPPEAEQPFNFTHSANMRHEIAGVRRTLQQGLTEPVEWDSRMSILTAEILTQARHDLGYKFDFEK